MKLLIITQKVNTEDPVLGFFHGWIKEFSKHFESISVICLEKGKFNLPSNVRVFSLGKEGGASKSGIISSFYRYIWKERKEYDAVFVHMNREYILLAGWLWRALSKKVYLWSNHPSGDKLTDLASIFCNNIFCTSKFSFTAKYKKTVFMPVGVDTELFKSNSAIEKTPRSILFLSRITPIKKPDQLIRALIELRKRSVKFNASFYGNALPADEKYRQSLIETVKSSGLGDSVSFYPGIPNIQAIEIYNRHEIFVNLSPQGMYDKTIFEAMACERLILASNNNLKGIIEDKFIFKEGDKDDLAKKLEALLAEGEEQKIVDGKTLRNVVIERHSLAKLGDKLAAIIGSGTSNL